MGLGGSKANVRGQGALLSNFPSGRTEYSMIDLQDACNCSINLNNPGKFTRGQILNELRDPNNYSVMCDCLMNEHEQGNEMLQGTLTDLVYSGIPVPANANENGNAANAASNAAASNAAANAANARNRASNVGNVVNMVNANGNAEGFVDLGNNNHILLMLIALVVLWMLYKNKGKLF